jgi:uncharacterized membrane protein YcjF (UPF0283 family)
MGKTKTKKVKKVKEKYFIVRICPECEARKEAELLKKEEDHKKREKALLIRFWAEIIFALISIAVHLWISLH